MESNKKQNSLMFYSQPWDKVRQSVLDLDNFRDKILASGLDEAEELFWYVDGFTEDLEADPEIEQQVINREMIRLSETDLIYRFINNPADAGLLTQVREQASYVAAGTNSLGALTLYPPSILAEIIATGEVVYNLNFVHTLRQAAMGLDTREYLKIIIPILTGFKEKLIKIDWIEAFIIEMCLWVVWREFKFLDEAAQKFCWRIIFIILWPVVSRFASALKKP